MTFREKTITDYQNKMIDCTTFERIVYSEAINLLNNKVNVDKVNHWVGKVITAYYSQPKPLSEKEMDRIANKKSRKREREEYARSLKSKLLELLDSYGLVILGEFDARRIDNNEIDLFDKIVSLSGYRLTILGDGLLHIYVSKKKIDQYFIEVYDNLIDQLDTFSPKTDNSIGVTDISEFREKINKLV